MTAADIRIAKGKGRESAGGEKRGPGRPTLSDAQLLDKALDLFLEQGFERTSIDAITASAGMAKRTVYARYGDKETLFRAALQRAIEEWSVPLEKLQQAECDDLEETLRRVGVILVGNIMKPEGLRLLRITNAESGRLPDIGAFTYAFGTEPTIVYLAELLRQRIGPDDVPLESWREAAVAFMYLVLCGPPTMTAWGMPFPLERIEDHTAYSVHLFLHGLLPRHVGAAPRPSVAESDPEAFEPYEPTHGSDELAQENRRLKKLLVASLLEAASLKEQLADR